MELIKDFTAEAQSFRRVRREKKKTQRFSAKTLCASAVKNHN
jgi:hypothetical protein